MRTLRLLVFAALAAVVGLLGVTDASAKQKLPRPPRTVELATPTTVRAAGVLSLYASPGDTVATATLEPTTDVRLAPGAARDRQARLLVPRDRCRRVRTVRPRGYARLTSKFASSATPSASTSRPTRSRGERDGAVVLTTDVAIGTPETPTPTGSFYVTDLLDNIDDSGPYGSFLLGLSASLERPLGVRRRRRSDRHPRNERAVGDRPIGVARLRAGAERCDRAARHEPEPRHAGDDRLRVAIS